MRSERGRDKTAQERKQVGLERVGGGLKPCLLSGMNTFTSKEEPTSNSKLRLQRETSSRMSTTMPMAESSAQRRKSWRIRRVFARAAGAPLPLLVGAGGAWLCSGGMALGSRSDRSHVSQSRHFHVPAFRDPMMPKHMVQKVLLQRSQRRVVLVPWNTRPQEQHVTVALPGSCWYMVSCEFGAECWPPCIGMPNATLVPTVLAPRRRPLPASRQSPAFVLFSSLSWSSSSS